MKFSPWFTIDIRHEYLDGGIFPNLLVVPTEACQARLQQHGLVFHDDQRGRIAVFARQEEAGGPFLRQARTAEYSFFVFLREQDFLVYTRLPARQADEVYVFSSDDAREDKPLTLRAGLMKKPPGNTSAPLLGLIRIRADGSPPLHFTLLFDAAVVKWKYYLVADKSMTTLAIDAKGTGITFSRNNQEDTPGADKVVAALQDTFPGAALLVFESNKAVPYSRLGRKNIQLINNSNQSIIINHLPNPDISDKGIKIINTLQ